MTKRQKEEAKRIIVSLDGAGGFSKYSLARSFAETPYVWGVSLDIVGLHERFTPSFRTLAGMGLKTLVRAHVLTDPWRIVRMCASLLESGADAVEVHEVTDGIVSADKEAAGALAVFPAQRGWYHLCLEPEDEDAAAEEEDGVKPVEDDGRTACEDGSERPPSDDREPESVTGTGDGGGASPTKVVLPAVPGGTLVYQTLEDAIRAGRFLKSVAEMAKRDGNADAARGMPSVCALLTVEEAVSGLGALLAEPGLLAHVLLPSGNDESSEGAKALRAALVAAEKADASRTNGRPGNGRPKSPPVMSRSEPEGTAIEPVEMPSSATG